MNWIGRRCLAIVGSALSLYLQASVCYANIPATIPFKANADADDNLIYRAIAAFLIAAAVAYGIAWCIKRTMPSFEKKIGRAKQLERLESMRLSPRSALFRVRWGNEELLVGESEHGVTLLGKRPVADTSASVSESRQVVKDSHE
jgi:flagellar biogenesis protein FliO